MMMSESGDVLNAENCYWLYSLYWMFHL